MLTAIPLSPEVKNKYHATLEAYFRHRREEDADAYYEGEEELPWSFWESDVDHLDPTVVCEVLPRAWENGDDVRVYIHYEGTDEECYSYMLRSEITGLLYIIFISANMSIHGFDEFTADEEAETEWGRIAS